MNLPWTYHINNKPDMKLTFSLFPTILDVDFTATFGEKKLSLIFQTWDPSNCHVHPENYGPEEFFQLFPPGVKRKMFRLQGMAMLHWALWLSSHCRFGTPTRTPSDLWGCFLVFLFGSLGEVTWIAWVLCGTSGCWNVQDLPIDVRKKHMEKMNLRINKNTAIFKKLRSFSELN